MPLTGDADYDGGMQKSNWGITAAQARAALKAAKGEPVMVRTDAIDSSPHAGRAKLLEVVNEKKAIILPLGGHNRREQVLLSSLKIWHSANAVKGVHIPMSTEAEPSNPAVSFENERFYLVSRKFQGVFGGKSRGWVQDPHKASLYDKSNINRALSKVRLVPMTDDAEAMTREQMLQVMGEWHGQAAIGNPIPVIPIQSEAPKPTPKPVASPSVARHGLNLADILADSGALLKELQDADAALRKAAQDVVDAEQMLAEATNALITANQTRAAVAAKFVGQTIAPRARETPAGAVRPRGTIKRKVFAVLMQSSRLSAEAVIERVRGVDESITEHSIKQTLLAMRAAGEAERDEGMNWALTEKGRESIRG